MHDGNLYKIALSITRWIGSVASIVVHTAFFVLCFLLVWWKFIGFSQMLLALTTVVSLEAIYLAIFIQMTVNLQSHSIREVEKDIDEIQEDVDEIQEDIDEIQEDVDEIQEDVEDIGEGGDKDQVRDDAQKAVLESIQADIRRLLADLEKAKQARAPIDAAPVREHEAVAETIPAPKPVAKRAVLKKSTAAKKKTTRSRRA